MVPPAVLLVPVFGIWTFDYQLDGTYSGIILLYVAMNLPFVIWILQSFIVQVPMPLEEAAKVDGANPLQIFFLVVLPIIKPGLAAAAIFTFRIAIRNVKIAAAAKPGLMIGKTTRKKICNGFAPSTLAASSSGIGT